MEYIVSNKTFNGASIIGNLFYQGSILHFNNYVAFCDGYLLDEKFNDFEQYINFGIEKHHAEGIYGIVLYDTQSDRLVVKGDYNGLRSIYIYEKDGHWAISNNVWLLVKQYKSDITINQDSLLSQIVFSTDIMPNRTIFNGIRRLNYGEKAECQENRQLLYSRYWDFNYSPIEISNEQRMRELDKSFTKTFSLIKKFNPNLKMGIGCSGGLDSRIIMHYANKLGIDTTAFVFCQKQRIKGINTVTYLMSDAVASYFGKSVIPIAIDADDIYDSIMLDLRNMPFGPCQLLKNPYKQLPAFDYMVTGQPGGLLKTPESALSNDFNGILTYTIGHLGNRMASFGKYKYFLRKLRTSFPFKFNPNKEDGFLGLEHSLIDSILPLRCINKSITELKECIENNKGANGYEKWQRLQASIVHSYQYEGGYESISNLRQSYYLYLPSCKTLVTTYMPTKEFLKQFIQYINPGLANIPDQRLNTITDGKFKNFIHQFEYIIRGQGINIESIIATKRYQYFAKEILNRDNPIFYANINKKKVLTNGILKTTFSPTLVKIKLMLDIFYYNEIEKLLSNNNWIKK